MQQCAEDACIALGFINPGDVATMMARMKKALKGLARCWTLYNLSWAVLALKAAFSMTRTTNVHGAVVWEYPRFERQACASAAMYARCDAKVALHPSPSPTSPRPATAQMCLPHRLCELQEWLIDERGCLTEWPVLLDLRAQQQAV